MEGNLRRAGVLFTLLSLLLVGNLSYLQVFGREKLRDNPANTRRILEEYSVKRGRVITADGGVAAESLPGKGPYRYLRRYPQGPLLCHVIGYDSPQFGRTGLEEEYNDFLLGERPARSWAQLMAMGEKEGNDLYLTLDLEVQRAAAQALGRRKGAVVAIDPRTGSVLALYSYPVFDPNELLDQGVNQEGRLLGELAMARYSKDPSSPLLNRATMGLYPPGSGFKVVTSAAALAHGITAAKTYFCPGVLPVDGSRVTNYGGRDYGTIDMETALTYSVNTYFAQLALEVGAEGLYETAAAFGLNRKPPLDLPSTVVSHIAGPREMSRVDLAWTGVGQAELLLTPLQLCLIGCALAHGGRIMKPHLLKEVRFRGEILSRYEPETWLTPVSPEVASRVLGMMVEVVRSGTGKAAAISGIRVAGKTGTAEVEGKPNHAWFLGVAPADDPRVVVAVIVENAGGTGGEVAAPVAREVMKAALR
jgi:peptidoglycan glycosyltransferase